ncbi:class I SAM-dependent methyltransferase [Herbaspirillum huttiense F1]|uniref:class I SAM-dependent methyltransferase n=1 Tax=Herbaspirillum TaxID=963 RepID=UPI00285BFDF6|nr:MULTISPECIES: class I SAM-dependent methyltransferase [Herbaspirillum]MDR6738526.1 SAM-dependent methyltransferase [Herbaspirillum sp. 1173]MDT0358253.1 class I SAM-dependent methyltransferase [Herbaspirillum huttiense F1]
MEWSNGYVHGIDYPVSFFAEQSPVHLSVGCVVHGVEPVPLDRPFTYMELGCGQGLTSAVLAAANPQGHFYAVDFLPTHVQTAREMVDAASLDNLTVIECSFEQMAGGEIDLPQFDFVTMYGVYSWVDAANRSYIAEFLRRYLKPGGIAYLNYNAMPGWSSALSLQRLLREFGRDSTLSCERQVAQGRALVEALRDQKAAAFARADSDGLGLRLEMLGGKHVDYLAHEYLNQGWDALYSIDVIQAMAAVKLDYVGSALLENSFTQLYLTQGQRELLAGLPNSGMRELAWDHLCNSSFREDIYVRGARMMSPARRDAWLERCGVALTLPRSRINLELTLVIGKINADARLADPMIEALLERPHSLVELAALPEIRSRGYGLREVASMAGLLMAGRQAAIFFLSSAGNDQAPAARLNRVIAARSRECDHFQALASPLLGNGVKSSLLQRVAYDQAGHAVLQPESWVQAMAQAVQRQGAKLERAGVALETPHEIDAELRYLAEAIAEQRMPVWRNLNMAPLAATP